MYRSLASRFLACLLGLSSGLFAVAGDAPAGAERGMVISSGNEGGGYWSAASRLQSLADELEFSVDVQTSTGSLENLGRLTDADSPVNLAFAQADALQYYLAANPGVGAQIETLENIGQECVFIITGRDSAIRSDADLQQPANYHLGIASPDSGIAVTFNYMTSQAPGLENTRVNFGDTRDAVTRLNDPDGGVDAVMVVHRPREYSAEVDLVLKNPDRYRFVEVADERLTKKLPGGQEVYQALNLAMPGAADDSKMTVKTICVKGLLLANKQKLGADQREKLYDVVNRHWMRVYATE